MKNISLLLFLLLSWKAFGQTASVQRSASLTDASPESVGISSERLKRVDAFIQKSVDDNVIPGAVAIICRNGKIVYHKSFGKADYPGNRALKNDDIFRIASMSKAITSTAVMMLWEEGYFQLDDPISKYIPEFANPVVLDKFFMSDSSYTTKPAGKGITIRQLLTHTAGIGYGIIDGDERMRAIYQKAGIVDLFTTDSVRIGDNIKKLAKLPLHHVPGEKFTYSEGLDVLGYLIEVVSGMSFDEFLRKRVFEPLGMNDTYFYVPEAKAARLVKIQHKAANGQWAHFKDHFYDPEYPIKGAKTFYSGGAGLSSTVKDYATFLQMYLNKGELNGKRLLSRKTVESIMMNQVGNLLGENSDDNYGLAFGLLTEKGQAKGGLGSKGTFVWGGYFNTSYFADPQENIIGVIMKQTQKVNDENHSGKFRRLVFQAVDN